MLFFNKYKDMASYKEINKYEPRWQLTRVRLKTIKNIEEKFIVLEEFLEANKTYEAWGRGINWLEGLKRGYKRSSGDNVLKCQDIIDSLESLISRLPHEEFAIDSSYIAEVLGQITTVDLLSIWTSLYDYEKDFTGRGYRHAKLELLVDQLYLEIDRRNHTSYLNLQKRPYENILGFRNESNSNKKTNTKRFFF